MSKKRLFFIAFAFFLHYLSPSFGQDASLLQQQDWSNVRVDKFSDAQIKRLVQAAEERNISVQNIQEQALIRGMPRTEINKLLQRISRIQRNSPQSRSGQRSSQSDTESDSLSQTSQRDSSLDIISEEERKVFGFSLFNSQDLTFEPNQSIATPQNYQLGPGDELLINVWGASQQNYALEVDRDGTVRIDNLGPVYVNGLTIEDAERRIIGRLSEIYAGLRGNRERPANTYAEVTLGQARSIKVTIVGEVRKPGTYTLSSLASAFNALYQSGGPTFIGSFRNIEIVREGKVVNTLDVYDFLVGGEQSNNNAQLQDQDIIRVTPYDTRIELKGQVKRPGYYEVKPEETLDQAVKFGGGFTDKAYTHRLKVTRKTPRAKQIIDVSNDEINSFISKNGDVVIVDSILNRYENRVEILGAVFRPGDYALTEGLTVRGLLAKAEGLREDAYAGRALLYRKGEDLTPQVVSLDLREVLSQGSDDIPLQREDVLRVYSITDLEEEYMVRIDGEVQDPDHYPYMKGMTLGDLIAMAGGMKESAYEAKVDVARPVKNVTDEGTNGSPNATAKTYHFDINTSLELVENASDFELLPSDQVFVRQSLDYEPQQTVHVIGEVAYPGEYAITSKDERISDLVERAGGLTSYSYREGAHLVRLNPEFYEEKALKEELLRDSLRYLRYQQYFLNDGQLQNTRTQNNKTQNNKIAPSQQQSMVIEEDIQIPRYRLVESETQNIGINLEKILEQPHSKYDIRLLPGDTLRIPKQLQTVRMSGEVLYPVSSRYDRSKGFKSYIAESGGFARNADKKRSYIVYANGSVDRTRSLLFIKNYPKVKPGAEIIVPQRPQKNNQSIQQLAIISSALATLSLVLIRVIDIAGN
uniref:SLBB domain-containing protein n=1 Tax=Roseihalotalea indica TaxID=2867963 RepID=A0AA49JJZ9_9BACT|nr:SLBB domain-containing protein [Tunicatimonas sp. TK19036]